MGSQLTAYIIYPNLYMGRTVNVSHYDGDGWFNVHFARGQGYDVYGSFQLMLDDMLFTDYCDPIQGPAVATANQFRTGDRVFLADDVTDHGTVVTTSPDTIGVIWDDDEPDADWGDERRIHFYTRNERFVILPIPIFRGGSYPPEPMDILSRYPTELGSQEDK